MDPYLVIFLINIAISFIANKCYDRNEKIMSALFLMFLIAINTLFSGLRDFGVGIDSDVYIVPYFQRALSIENVKDFILCDGDKGFLLIAYVSTLISNEPQSLLLLIALFIHLFIYMALWQYKKVFGVNLFVSTALFCIVFYCHTLNLMRQFCAIAILSYAFSLFVQSKKKSYFVLQVLACFFHSTSVFFVFVPLFWYISKLVNTQKRNIYLGIIIVVFLLLIPSYYYIVSLLGDFTVISNTYAERYGESSEFIISKTSSGTGLGKIFQFVYPIAFVVWGIYKKCMNNKILVFILVLSIVSSVIQVLSYQVQFVDRIGFYFSFIMYVFLVKLFTSKKISGFIKILIFSIYIFNWMNMYVIGGGGNIYPYKSKILEITK